MKVFLYSSPVNIDKNRVDIKEIFALLKKLNCSHTSDLILKVEQEKFVSPDEDFIINFYKKITENIKKADIVLFEISQEATDSGYFVEFALDHGKPVIVLYKDGNSPTFLNQIQVQNDKLIAVSYSGDDLEKNLANVIELARDQTDVRFNFFISPGIGLYLDWVAKTKKIPRAAYLRRLIEDDKQQSKYANNGD